MRLRFLCPDVHLRMSAADTNHTVNLKTEARPPAWGLALCFIASIGLSIGLVSLDGASVWLKAPTPDVEVNADLRQKRLYLIPRTIKSYTHKYRRG